MATVVTTVGRQWIVDKLDESVDTKANKIAWGTGAGTAVVGGTALFTEASEARVVGTESQPAADTYRAAGTLTADANKTITNAGTFDAASAGVLVIHGDFTGVVLNTGDSITFNCDLQIT